MSRHKTSRWAAAALCIATLNLLSVGCSALSSSDDFVPTEQDAATEDTADATQDAASDPDLVYCTALCEGFDTCNVADFVASDCITACTQSQQSNEGSVYDCYLDVVDEETDQSEDPEDIEDAAAELCNLLRFGAQDVAACNANIETCDGHCSGVEINCTESNNPLIYVTCMNACIDLQGKGDAFSCALTELKRVAPPSSLSISESQQSCSIATKGCQDRECIQIDGPNNTKNYTCAEACKANNSTPCPGGSYCNGDPSDNANGETVVFCVPEVKCGNKSCSPGERCVGMGMESTCECGSSPTSFSCGPGERCVNQNTGPGPVDNVCKCGDVGSAIPSNGCPLTDVCVNNTCVNRTP